MTDLDKAYFRKNYTSALGRYESYWYFIEKGISLKNHNGRFSLIVPDTWLNLRDAILLRKLVLSTTQLDLLTLLHENVFKGVKVDVCVFVISKFSSQNKTKIKIASKDHKLVDFLVKDFIREFEIDQMEWLSDEEYRITFNISSFEKKLIIKLEENSILLNKIAIATTGPKPYQVGKGKPPQTKKTLENKPFTAEYKIDSTFRVMLRGADISRYSSPRKDNEWLSYGEWLAEVRDPSIFSKERLLVQSIRNPKLLRRIISTYINNDFVNNNSITNVVMREETRYNLKYILGILNSNLINWFFVKSYHIVNIDPRYLKLLLIRIIDFTKSKEVEQHDRMVSLVERMLELHKCEPFTPQEADSIQRQIAATDTAIDKLVYELYGLTEEEIAIVEGEK